jgi:glycosyltransferase involved in cell wall biosynthesis
MHIKKLSVVVPVFNEEGNMRRLHDEIRSVCLKMMEYGIIGDYELILVDDGSTDGTGKIVYNLREVDDRLRYIRLRKNFGQTPALKAGFDNVTGDYVVTMDGDLQNDPADIPALIMKMSEGYDVVSGWRYNRKDKFGKRVSSKVMNFLRKKLVGDELHDYGCSLKLYKRECLKDIELFGELHRYITAYLYIKGYKIGEVKVNHRARKSGITKYKFNRGLNGLLDLFFLKFWAGYSNRPLHFFGRLGIYQWALAGIIVVEQIIKAIIINSLNFGPLLALASMLVITGGLTMIFGFISEILSRVYFREHQIYSIERII